MPDTTAPVLPTVTIIIPTRGKLAFVRQCLKSLFASGADSDARLDVVVIEGGGEEGISCQPPCGRRQRPHLQRQPLGRERSRS